LDTVALHLEGHATDPTHFNGATSITFESAIFPECNCKYWYEFDAVHAP
jgi:hypothetical protein